MKTRISESVLFYNIDAESGERKSSAIPLGLSDSVLAEFDKTVPELKGIIEHPSIDPAGRVMMEHGYDKETGLFLHLGGESFLPVPDEPTKAEAQAAYAFLRNEVLADFPFASELDAVVAVSMFLSKVRVRFFEACPIYAITAAIQSSGKTELMNVVSLSIDGRPVATQPWPDGENAEMKKTITACLREGHSLVMFDNVPDGSTVRSTHLAHAVTSGVIRDRVLGFSETVTVPANMMFALTGNNLSFSGDMPTRVLTCEIDTKVGDPQKRRFTRDNLTGWCLANRKRTILAALTILRAFDAAGGESVGAGSRFPVWSRCVRDPLMWLTGLDLLTVFDDVASEDPDGAQDLDLLKTLAELYSDPFIVKDVVEALSSKYNKGFGSLPDSESEATDEPARDKVRLLEELERLLEPPFRGDDLVGHIGLRFRKMRNRIVQGLKLVKTTKRKPTKWLVVRAEPLVNR